jgi:hypothetical protein
MSWIGHRSIRRVLTPIMALIAYLTVVFAKRSHRSFVTKQWRQLSPSHQHCARRVSFLSSLSTCIQQHQHVLDCRKSAQFKRWESTAVCIGETSFASDHERLSKLGEKTWSFLPRSNDGPDSKTIVQNILVCGDGDLSFSAEIAAELECLNISLIATVLEDEQTHSEGMCCYHHCHTCFDATVQYLQILFNSVYQFSVSNTREIQARGHNVMFGVDATQLSTYFGTKSGNSPILFDRVQFNFPHWKGKANNRYNR